MSYHEAGYGAPDYAPCRYGTSRIAFRGPERDFGSTYIAVLGGTETFGRHVETPYPDLLENALGLRCVNFGVAHAGPDAFLADETVLGACAAARLTVICVSGAHLVRNKFYAVHTRRNDRIIRQTDLLGIVFPEVDFSRYQFVRHMLNDLHDRSPSRFSIVRDELRRIWVQRMNLLCARIAGDVVLLWIGDRTPEDRADSVLQGDPPLVTRDMLRALRGRIRGTVEVVEAPGCGETGLAGKLYAPGERMSALHVPGPAVHEEAAGRLEAMIGPMLSKAAPIARIA